MKKFLAILLSLTLTLSFVSCKKETKLEKFDTDPTIEKTVLYDKNNIKITANELTYGNFSAELSVTIENNSDTSVSFTCGTISNNDNSVNGYMIDSPYLNCDIDAGKSETKEFSYNYNQLNIYGITSIADIGIGFEMSTEDDYNYAYTGPLQIKTSIFDSYDYSKDSYQKVVKSGALEKAFDCKINHFSTDVFYDNYNVRISSATVITNTDGEPTLLLEIENNSNEKIFTRIEDGYLNGCSVDDALWAHDEINAGKKSLTHISLSDLAEEYEGDFSDISKVSNISFSFSIGEGYKAEDTKKISIDLPDIEIPQKEK